MRAIVPSGAGVHPSRMRPDLATIVERVTLLRAQCASAPDGTLLDQIEDVLSEGYGQALAGDAWSISRERRLQQIISERDQPLRGQRLRCLADEHARFQRELVALRRELAALRRDRDRLAVAARLDSAR